MYYDRNYVASKLRRWEKYLNDFRLQKAVELLNDPNQKYTFSEVCSACRFNNSATLYRHLKKIKTANPCFDDK